MATATSNGNSKKPNESKFRQQQLPAWQPILTAGTVLPTFFVIGIAFIPIGIGMLYFSESVMEKVIDYTNCNKTNADGLISDKLCSEELTNDPLADCECRIDFTLDQDWSKDVFLYYGLTNFYQNHRRYVKSRDDKQLLGQISSTPSTDCKPFDIEDGLPVVPCGAIANSLFSDRIRLFYYADATKTGGPKDRISVDMWKTGIAWDSDKNWKFKNPDVPSGQSLADVFNQTAKPAAWRVKLWELDTENPDNNGLQNEDLIVWMRTAALPNFRKLYRRINHTEDEKNYFRNGLPAGDYQFEIDYRYEVKQFSGNKSVILSQTSVLGGKNPFLGIAYIVVGSICLIIGVIFLFVHIKHGKKTSEIMGTRSSFT